MSWIPVISYISQTQICCKIGWIELPLEYELPRPSALPNPATNSHWTYIKPYHQPFTMSNIIVGRIFILARLNSGNMPHWPWIEN